MSLSVRFHGQADAYRQLCWAVTEDDGEKITALIAAGADPDQSDERGVTLLHMAAETIKPKALKALIDGGANIHKCDNESHSVLRAAMRGKNLACVETLLAAGADTYNFSYDPDDGRPASDNMFSLNCGWDISRAVHRVSDAFMINQTVNNPHYEGAKDLDLWLQDGKTPVDTLDRFGKTALIHACEYGYAECARKLLERAADPNFPGRDGRLPIHALATGKNPAMVQQLVAAGARLTAKDPGGLDALELARKAGNEPMAAALEKAFNDFTAAATVAAGSMRTLKPLKFKGSLP